MNEYGPYTAEVERMLKAASKMSSAQEIILSDMEIIRDPYAWANAFHSASDSMQDGSYRYACWHNALSSLHDVMMQSIAWGSARDALLAIMTKELISVEYFNILYFPWKLVMEK